MGKESSVMAKTENLFKGDRGKNKEKGLKARLDSLTKTLEFVSKR